MPDIVIEPATSDRFADVQAALTGGGDGRSCQCQWWTLTNAQFQSTSPDERRDLIHHELADDLSPGLVAYVDGEAAGWVRVGPRTRQARLGRTRAYTATSVEPWDDDAVWAVSCFSVRREHRQIGLNAQLLDAAIAYARSQGARVIEAYPIDTDARPKVSSNDLFHGALTTFEAAGFEEVGRPKPDVAVVSLALVD